tara:strand:- start:121 stop:411 length:291 start_codon:yes stop_codon:yes gene_type:complete
MLKNLKNIKNIQKYETYTQYKLDNIYNIDNNQNNLKILLKEINFNNNTRFFINKTHNIDSINVVDIDNIRFIEFENDIHEFTNKGLDNSYEFFIDN